MCLRRLESIMTLHAMWNRMSGVSRGWAVTGTLAGCVLVSQGLAQGPLLVNMQYESSYRHVNAGPPVFLGQPFVFVVAQTSCEAEDIEVTHTNPTLFQQPLEFDLNYPSTPPVRGFTRFYNATTEAGLFVENPSGQHIFATRSDTDPLCLEQNSFNQPFPSGGWPSTVPAFALSTFGQLAGMDVNQPAVLTFNGYTGFAGATSNVTFLYTIAEGVISGIDLTLSPSTTSVVIPPGTLRPGTTYEIVLRFFSTREQTVNFRDHTLSFGRTTFYSFTTGGDPLPECPADLGGEGGSTTPDGMLDNNDFIVFIQYFFDGNSAADLGTEGGAAGSDGVFDNNDFIVFIQAFFAGC
jgi:hypothetical protein